ncbi:IclR family transcription regulator [Natronomonas moolapensis 8.8.11]|uniref:IclR family transcription regulator n=1 Tax=Natronomonas moolapensis (strain DSM 18674 / CECT 7526 / JCM 14361 / 8.8.11) TaxID=268739 RepID=M1Y5L8_NATM8|nr:IclR family transcriptional regulator [Natronomonas moolapensis]CCQ37865.1 IclR family transcription regulator [Natronomonas moolapensis 8.8.11]
MDDDRVRATETSIRMLEGLIDLGGEAGITELATHLSVAKSTVYKHLNTLESSGLVVKHGDSYRIGLRALEFGGYAQRYDGVYDTARPQLRKMADETGELANLMFEEDGWGVYVHTSRGEDAVDIDTQTGRRAHLHATGLGKAILATLPEERVEEIVDSRGLPGVTEHTITDRTELLAELEKIRAAGIAYDREECVEGMACIARPLSTPSERPAAISITGPVSRVSSGGTEATIRTVLEEAGNVIELELTG